MNTLSIPVPRGRQYQSSYYSGSLYPNGKFTLGEVQRNHKKIVSKERKYNRQYDLSNFTYEKYEDENGLAGIERNYDPVGRKLEQGRSLEFTYLPNCHRPSRIDRVPRGTHGLTSHGKLYLENAAYLLERDYGKERLAMLTLTLPNLDDVSTEYLSRNWANILRKSKQELFREIERKGGVKDYCAVTEVQTKRYLKYGQIAYHLHMLYVASRSKDNDWYLTPHEISSIWKRIIKNQLNKGFQDGQLLVNYLEDHREKLDKFWGIDCQKIKKSASAYLCKYLSKGDACLAKELKDSGLLVATWYHLAKSIRQKIKQETIKLSESFCSYIDRNYESLKDNKTLYRYLHFCPIELPKVEGYDKPYQIRAYCGQLTELGIQNYLDEWAIVPIEIPSYQKDLEQLPDDYQSTTLLDIVTEFANFFQGGILSHEVY